MARFSFAREDDSSDVVPDATTAPNPDELAENQLADVSDEMGEIEGDDAAVGEMTETAVAIGDTTDSVEAAVDAGNPPDENTMDALATATEHMFNRVGQWRGTTKMKMESMSGNYRSRKDKASRLRIAREGVDEWKARLKKLWDTIVAAVKKAIETVVGFFTKLFSSAGGVKKRADALVKRIEGMKDMTISAEDKVSSGSFFKALRKDNRMASESEIKAFTDLAIKNDAGDIAIINGMKIDLVKAYVTKAQEAIKSVDNDDTFNTKLNDAISAFGTIIPQGSLTKGNDYVKAAPGVSIYETKLPLGDMSAYKLWHTATAGDSEQVGQALAQMKLNIEKSTGYKEDAKSEDVAPVASIDKCKELAEAISKAMAHYDGKPKILEEIKKMGEEVKKAMEEATKKGEKSDDQMKTVYKNSTTGAILGRVCQSILTTFLSKVKHYEIMTSKGVCDYVSLSLDKAKKAGAKAAEATTAAA